MIWTGLMRMGTCALALAGLAACGQGQIPDDVAQGVGFSDYQDYQSRRATLPMTATQTVMPPADLASAPFAQPRSPTSSRAPATPDGIARVASAAIDEAENGPAIAASGDDFVAPPLPEGMSVLGANVVSFALSTSHPVGERVWSRFPFRLGRSEVQCSDFRTTDLAQDWFLENDGPERDRAGLDPDGDGFACNWDPGRYRAQARGDSMPQPIFPTAPLASDG